MSRSLAPLWGAPLALLLLAGASARADLVGYSYSWGVTPGPVLTGTNPSTQNGDSTGSVDLARAVPGTASSLLNSATPTRIEGATITTTSSAGTAVAGPDNYNTPLGLQLSLTDTASGQSGRVSFGATLAGTLTHAHSDLTAAFAGPLTQTLTLGGHVYSVTVDPAQVHIPDPGTTALGHLDALVAVSGAHAAPAVSQAPEPSTLSLAGLGLALFGARRRWRRRSHQPGAASA